MQKVGCAGYLCLILAICLLVLCLLTGCSDNYPEGLTFTCRDLTVTLPGDFIDLSGDGIAKDADFLYGRKTLIVMGLSEKKADLKEMTLEEYTAYVIQGNQLTCTPQRSGDGFLFSYETPVEGDAYTYVIATFEGHTNFWILQFYCPTANFSENKPEIDIILEGIRPNVS